MKPGLLSVGYITKANGLKGDVVVFLTSNRTERVAVGSVLSTSKGDLTVDRSAPFQDRWRVHFLGVNDRNGAEALQGTELFAAPLEDPDALWVHEMIGANVELLDGTPVGVVREVESNPASDLLVLDSGRLVPLVFVVASEKGRLVIDPPLGLLDDDDAIAVRGPDE
jgi:16S rRNA processing protein RimM